MKIRHVCAVLGVAAAVGAVVFVKSLVATNDRQSIAVAERLLDKVKVVDGAKFSSFALDHRPGGRVMQGPPLMATVAVDDSIEEEGIVLSKSVFAARRLQPPPVGSMIRLVGKKGAYSLKLISLVDWDRPIRGYPTAFVNSSVAGAIGEKWNIWRPKSAKELSALFKSDAQRNFDRARSLLVWAAVLTALCMLVNSLFLSVEARRKEIATLRMLGMTRSGVFGMVASESFALAAKGLILGVLGAAGALWLYVAFDRETYPLGMDFSLSSAGACALAMIPVAALAVLAALKRALSVSPAEAASNRAPRKRHLGMVVSFACGFGAFVAVEVWGASLMSAFVPSKEWPDAIVSILPGGVSSFDIDKLQGRIEGVSRIHELSPLQVDFFPKEKKTGRGGREYFRNALLLGSDWLPDFRFVSGERSEAEAAIKSGDNCIITEMMARARGLKLGDEVKLDAGRGLVVSLKVVGIVDLNWHMVTSRGLLRGLNRKPVDTDGPLFVSFDTVEMCDLRPAPMVKMTHLWLDYEPEFLSKHGVFPAGRLVEKSIVGALGLLKGEEIGRNSLRLHSRDEIADGTLSHGVDIIGSMARVPFIFIAVVAIGFVAMLVSSADSRKYEFRALEAVGATKLQLSGILALEALRTALSGIAAGFPLGALTGWLFTAATRATMSHWGLPASFAVPWQTVAQGALGAMFFALAVAVPASLFIFSLSCTLRSNNAAR